MLPESALTLRDQLARGEISSRELTEHYLRRIEARTDLGAFVYVSDQALEAADRADRAYVRARTEGRPLGRLHGLPTAFKDLTDVAGMPTTHGSAAIEHKVAKADHPLVRQLRGEGVIVLGKTQVPEFGLTSYSENLIAKPSRNPFDPERSSGGSSGGQAAAVAAQLIPVGAGSDGGGSIRIPAAACGLVGLKPALGRVPADVYTGFEDPYGAPKLAVSGPLAQNAEDAALLLDAMRGSDHFLPSLRQDAAQLRGVRVGYSTHSPFKSAYEIALSAEAEQAFEQGLSKLSELHEVQPARFEYATDYPETFAAVWTNGLKDMRLADESRLGALAQDFRARAQERSARQSARAATRIRQIAGDFIQQWSAHDVVATPALAGIPPVIGHYTRSSADVDYMLQCQYSPYTSMVNVASVAAISVPICTTEQGLPMGIQLISAASNEGLLLALAAQISM